MARQSEDTEPRTTDARWENPKDPPVTWTDIETRVLDGFDAQEVAQRSAVKLWLKHVEAERAGDPLGKVVHAFASNQVLAAAVAFFQADIEEDIAIFRAKVARNRRYEAYVQVRCALGIHEGVFLDDEMSIVVERLAVIRGGREEEQAKNRELLDLSQALAEARTDPEEVIAGAQLPGSLREDDGVKAFLADLVEFILANGKRGRDMVDRVCKDEKVASHVVGDDNMPKALRFLASISIELSRDRKTLPAERRPVGFAAAIECG
jgi:hypothetical protein